MNSMLFFQCQEFEVGTTALRHHHALADLLVSEPDLWQPELDFWEPELWQPELGKVERSQLQEPGPWKVELPELWEPEPSWQ